jgi:molecular chaperone HtpG
MSKAELAQHLGTIARSGTLAFARSLAEAPAAEKPSLIGQFGVGFYSAFMVAERVEVTSRRAGTEEAWVWQRGAQIRRVGAVSPTPFGIRRCGRSSGVPAPTYD